MSGKTNNHHHSQQVMVHMRKRKCPARNTFRLVPDILFLFVIHRWQGGCVAAPCGKPVAANYHGLCSVQRAAAGRLKAHIKDEKSDKRQSFNNHHALKSTYWYN